MPADVATPVCPQETGDAERMRRIEEEYSALELLTLVGGHISSPGSATSSGRRRSHSRSSQHGEIPASATLQGPSRGRGPAAASIPTFGPQFRG